MPSLIKTGRHILGQTAAFMKEAGLSGRAFVITDRNVYASYAEALTQALKAGGFEPAVYIVNPGEQTKSLEALGLLYDWLVEAKAERSDVLVALGGGVVGDLAGFAAASYLRGLSLVQIPTTLLAQVDSSIGGKTGVNHPKGKNLIGAFYPAHLVIIDTATLASLPAREYRSGLAEVVKYGIIMDGPLFDLVETRQADLLKQAEDVVDEVVARCAALKTEVVGEDERESGRRTILNYGHTIGHALEVATGYEVLLHGEAVAIGMSGAAQIAVALGKLDETSCERIKMVLKGLGLPYAARGLAWELVRDAMSMDKKTRAGRIRWVLPISIGSVEVTPDVPG
ncbi:MAG: 3-dehydroquinate synthase, partial [Chloroflexota bacterium]|nr:3-dehydroquinate synthase [Chloroflexota bacterium]